MALVLSLTVLTVTASAQATCSATSKCGQMPPAALPTATAVPQLITVLVPAIHLFLPAFVLQTMPKCKPQTISFENNAKPYIPASAYRETPTKHLSHSTSGTVIPSKSGAKLLLTKDGDAKLGTLLSSTRYFYYGQASAVMKHGSWAGVVNTFIGMSGTK